MPGETAKRAHGAAAPRGRRNAVLIGVLLAFVVVVVGGLIGASVVRARHVAEPAKATATATKSTSSAKKKLPASAEPASASASTLPTPVEVADPALDQAVPVLMYHHILPVPSNFIAISPSTFDSQMKYLHDHGFHPVSIAELQDFVLTGKRLPSKPVLITFDDGRMNQLTYGVPILKKYGFTATFFVVRKWIVSSSKYFMHEPELKDLMADGYDVQSHTTNHMMLYRFHSKSTGKYESYASMKTRMWAATEGMRVWMDKTLDGPPVTALAYPGGGNDKYTWQLAKEAGYEVAFTTNTGYVTYKGQDPLDLPRWNTGARGITQATFVSIVSGAQHYKRK